MNNRIIVGYKIATGIDFADLSFRVATEINTGWQPFCAPFGAPYWDASEPGVTYFQAMVKYA